MLGVLGAVLLAAAVGTIDHALLSRRMPIANIHERESELFLHLHC